MTKDEIYKVGNIEKSDARIIRIVHISDTHMLHDGYLSMIPEGDILVHSGDFSAFSASRYIGNKDRDRASVVNEMNSFFQKLPFKYKVLVAGNHELSFNAKGKSDLESQLTEVTYLQDRAINIEGINIYGTPWTSKRWTSLARGFSKSWGKFEHFWDLIPSETDVLVTHMPPLGIMDLASKKFAGVKNLLSANEPCTICGDTHEMFEHWGCKELKKTVLKRVRPVVHMFGHVHESTGVQDVDGVTFSNAAMKINQTVNVFDYYL